MIGTCTPARSSPSTMAGTAAAAASLLTVTRTSSLPARASAATCRTVAITSAVSVLVMDCTTIGCPDPTGMPPTRAVTVLRRSMVAIHGIWRNGHAGGSHPGDMVPPCKQDRERESAKEAKRCSGRGVDTEGRRCLPAPFVLSLLLRVRGSDEAELADQALHVSRVHHAAFAKWHENRHDLRTGTVNAAVPELADHPGKSVLVLIGVQLAAGALLAEALELLHHAGGTDRRECTVGIMCGHSVVLLDAWSRAPGGWPAASAVSVMPCPRRRPWRAVCAQAVAARRGSWASSSPTRVRSEESPRHQPPRNSNWDSSSSRSPRRTVPVSWRCQKSIRAPTSAAGVHSPGGIGG